MWGNRCTPLLQQEQDRREIPDSQMLLLSWTGGGNDESGTIVCRRYAWHLPLLLVFPILSPVMQKTAKISTPAALPLVRFIVQGGVGGGGGKVWDFYGPQRLWMLQNWIAHHFNVQRLQQIMFWAEKRHKAGSFNITLKMTLVTGELIPISPFYCNGSDRGFLEFWHCFFFFLSLLGNVRGSCFSPKSPLSSLRPWLPFYQPLLLHPNVLQSGLTLTHAL